ncbi:multidrug transporter subunit MdtD [Janthinobacterium sp. 17J80-10]|uniref:multidrug transporter subunit MdtD n=1 Tax=Janthinobacterium sp. 17J80-10 TaxID=2497863 RepID=UPI0010055F0A|nr:multidrug transporter subunit MdtD [Janthinobacterium sp. 17J80-10]QAU33057.1 DHA2 family efflux MFS transporter permease subunit [Janthinobacterium sp. 17J80-10]
MAISTTENSQRMLLWLVAVAFFMQTLDATIVNTALPAMAASLGESPLRMQSVIIAYTLAMATLIPASGWIADRFGTRRVFLGALILFSLGSLLCAYAPSLSWLTAARALQGAGGAMLLPVGRLAVLRAFPREKFMPAMTVVAIPGLIGPLLGPTLGGWLVEYASWHWIFLINIPIGALGCMATLSLMPDFRAETRARFDLAGYVLLAASMVMISLALDGLADRGMRQAVVVVLIVFGLACLAAYWLRASRHAAPLFPLALFKVNSFSVGSLGNLFARIGTGSMPFLIPLLLQVKLGYSALHAGVMMIPVAIGGMLVKRFATALVRRAGYRNVLIGNTVLVGACIASFALFSESLPLWLRIAQLGLFGAINSLQFSAMNAVTLKDLPPSLASSGNSLHSMVQMLSMSLGVAVAGGLLATFTGLLAQPQPGAPSAFQATFLCMGVITAASAWIFWQLPARRLNVRGE